MSKTTKLVCVVALVLGACGGGGSSSGAADSKVGDAAAAIAFSSVTCPTTPDAVITTSGLAYSPKTTTLAVGQTVQFVMPASHNVSGTGTATALTVDFGGTGCFKFTSAGTASFLCTAHQFTGSIVVQ